MLRKLFLFSLIVGFLGMAAAAVFGLWGYYYITRDLPNLQTIEDYRPPAVSYVYSNDGTPIAEFYRDRRYPAKLDEIPVAVRNCFLAAEDANFYHHAGIDPMGILRAMVKNFMAGGVKQGGSTITQQVVKNLLLSEERSLTRKAKEAILSYQLEKRLSKDEILEMYLNQIFFGNTAYGIKAAARIYFHKELPQLSLAEGAMLAGLPKAPSRYSPIANIARAKRRQRYVLDRMVKAGFVTQPEADEAFLEEIKAYAASNENIFYAPYFVSEVRRHFTERWPDLNPDLDGLQIYTTVDLSADRYATAGLRRGLREVDKRRGWRGPIDHISAADPAMEFLRRYSSSLRAALLPDEIYPALITKLDHTDGSAEVNLGTIKGSLSLRAAWAQRLLDANDVVHSGRVDQKLKLGDVIEVSLLKEPPAAKDGKPQPRSSFTFQLDQTPGKPNIEGAVVLLDPHSGKVAAIVGGYSFGLSPFNRATQSLRQPGSSFKPILYLAAVDGFKYTPSTIVNDTPRTFRVGDEFWTPNNFDEKFLGQITLRSALEKSRNLVSADIVSRIGIDPVIQYARKLGITSKLGRNLSLSLGSSEVTLLELSRAYGVFAARGVLFDTVMVTKIISRDGKVLYDYEEEKLNHAHQAINENSAFVMANMMKGVIERGTGTRVKEIERPVAGKTGTSNDHMDTWFVGYTPQWVCGVWVGFDQKRNLGDQETGGRTAAPVWVYVMKDFLKDQDRINYAKLVEETKAEAARLGINYVAPDPLQPLDFSVPDGVDPFWVDKTSGRITDPSNPNAIHEYFVRGTEPKAPEGEAEVSSYLESPDL
ncbi:MAG: PBP1A family penicillin-binding protein [Oligoflexia bacterium]|nr:PBP1A family penicillin-binding protein [Oligoflexia bacterium]